MASSPEPFFSGATPSAATSVVGPSAFENIEARLETTASEFERLTHRVARLEHTIVSIPVRAVREHRATRDLIPAPGERFRSGIFASDEHPDSATASPRYRKRQQQASRARAVLVSLFLIGLVGLVLYLLSTLAGA